jgi:hypothetical protein
MKFLPKPFFLFGDVLSCAITGLLVGMACQAVIPSGWNMVVAMFPGMLLGMVIPLFLAPLVFGRYFGAMEVMVPCMLGGMLAGMWISMAVTMHPVSLGQAATQGVMIAIGALVVCYLLDAFEKMKAKA